MNNNFFLAHFDGPSPLKTYCAILFTWGQWVYCDLGSKKSFLYSFDNVSAKITMFIFAGHPIIADILFNSSCIIPMLWWQCLCIRVFFLGRTSALVKNDENLYYAFMRQVIS